MANEQNEPSGKDRDAGRLPKDELTDQEAELREEIARLRKKIESPAPSLDDDDWALPDLDDEDDEGSAVHLRPRPAAGQPRRVDPFSEVEEPRPSAPPIKQEAKDTKEVTLRPAYREAAPGDSPPRKVEKAPVVPNPPENPEMELVKIVGRRLFLTIFLVGVILVVWIAFQDAEPRSDVTSAEAEEERIDTNTAVEDVTAVIETLEAFSLAPTLEEKAQYVMDSEEMLPVMQSFYETNPVPGKSEKDDIKVIFNRSTHIHAGVPRDHLIGTVLDEYEKKADYILGKRGGEWLIDWKGSVGYNEASIAELANADETGEAVLRVLASTSDYYNYGYTKEEYASFLMRTFDPEEPGFHAFIKRDSELLSRLSGFVAEKRRRAVTLRFRFPEEIDDAIAEIVTLEKMNWVD